MPLFVEYPIHTEHSINESGLSNNLVSHTLHCQSPILIRSHHTLGLGWQDGNAISNMIFPETESIGLDNQLQVGSTKGRKSEISPISSMMAWNSGFQPGVQVCLSGIWLCMEMFLSVMLGGWGRQCYGHPVGRDQRCWQISHSAQDGAHHKELPCAKCQRWRGWETLDKEMDGTLTEMVKRKN